MTIYELIARLNRDNVGGLVYSANGPEEYAGRNENVVWSWAIIAKPGGQWLGMDMRGGPVAAWCGTDAEGKVIHLHAGTEFHNAELLLERLGGMLTFVEHWDEQLDTKSGQVVN